MRPRSGYSLIECLVAISLIATTFTLVATSLHGMYRSSQSVRQDVEMETEWFRFAGQFRADAHQALSFALEEKSEPEVAASALSLAWPDGRNVRYALRPQHIERVVLRGDEVVHRETYRLPAPAIPHWQINRDRLSPIVSLVLAPKPMSAKSVYFVSGEMRVDAALGLIQPQSTPSKLRGINDGS